MRHSIAHVADHIRTAKNLLLSAFPHREKKRWRPATTRLELTPLEERTLLSFEINITTSGGLNEPSGGAVVLCLGIVSNPPTDGRTISFNYQTKDGSARAGADYVGSSGTVTLTSSNNYFAFVSNVATVIDDSQKEPVETFGVRLTKVSGFDPGAFFSLTQGSLNRAPIQSYIPYVVIDNDGGVTDIPPDYYTNAVCADGSIVTDAPNNPKAPSAVLLPGEVYFHKMVFALRKSASSKEMVQQMV
mgnify:CR=1 FL=1